MDTQSKQYKKLQAIWDKRLKDSGFKDIEKRNEGTVIWPSGFHTGYHNEITMEAKRDYYVAAEHFLNSHQFSNRAEKRMWELHSQGISIRDIVALMTEEKIWIGAENRKNGAPNKRVAHERIKKLARIMMTQLKRDELSD